MKAQLFPEQPDTRDLIDGLLDLKVELSEGARGSQKQNRDRRAGPSVER
jgi:hypothetical protein